MLAVALPTVSREKTMNKYQMKKLWLLVFLAVIGCERKKDEPPTPATPASIINQSPGYQRKVIVVMAGQSNMMGIGQDGSPGREYFTRTPAVVMIRADTGDPYAMMGPGASAGIFYTAAHPGTQFIGIMCAKGSTSIDSWGPGSALLEACLSRARSVRDAEQAPIIGFFWDQGEQDAYLGTLGWPEKLTELVRYSKCQLNLSTFPVIYSQLGQTDDTYGGQWDPFKLTQAEAQQPGFVMVRTDDLPAIGHVHHDYAANLEIGRRFAQYMGDW